MEKKELIGELEHCLKEWKDKGYCTFGKRNNCEQCAAPYLVLKMISREIIHGDDQPRLNLEDWKKKLYSLKETCKEC